MLLNESGFQQWLNSMDLKFRRGLHIRMSNMKCLDIYKGIPIQEENAQLKGWYDNILPTGIIIIGEDSTLP